MSLKISPYQYSYSMDRGQGIIICFILEMQEHAACRFLLLDLKDRKLSEHFDQNMAGIEPGSPAQQGSASSISTQLSLGTSHFAIKDFRCLFVEQP